MMVVLSIVQMSTTIILPVMVVVACASVPVVTMTVSDLLPTTMVAIDLGGRIFSTHYTNGSPESRFQVSSKSSCRRFINVFIVFLLVVRPFVVS